MTGRLRAILLPALLLLACAAAHAADADGAMPSDAEHGPKLAADLIPVQIATARVGDWASYTNADGHTLRLTVVERWTEHGDDHLVIRSSLKKGKKKRETHSDEQVSVKERVADARDLGRDDFLGESTVLVGGRRLDCIVVNYRDRGGELTRQSYLSDEVPVYGLVRGVLIEGNKRTTVLRLEDFGFADEDGKE